MTEKCNTCRAVEYWSRLQECNTCRAFRKSVIHAEHKKFEAALQSKEREAQYWNEILQKILWEWSFHVQAAHDIPHKPTEAPYQTSIDREIPDNRSPI